MFACPCLGAGEEGKELCPPSFCSSIAISGLIMFTYGALQLAEGNPALGAFLSWFLLSAMPCPGLEGSERPPEAQILPAQLFLKISHPLPGPL